MGNMSAEMELQRLQQEHLRRQEMVRRNQHSNQHNLYAGHPLGLLPLLEQMRPQPPQAPPNVSTRVDENSGCLRLTFLWYSFDDQMSFES